jgi:hypothetical protein
MNNLVKTLKSLAEIVLLIQAGKKFTNIRKSFVVGYVIIFLILRSQQHFSKQNYNLNNINLSQSQYSDLVLLKYILVIFASFRILLYQNHDNILSQTLMFLNIVVMLYPSFKDQEFDIVMLNFITIISQIMYIFKKQTYLIFSWMYFIWLTYYALFGKNFKGWRHNGLVVILPMFYPLIKQKEYSSLRSIFVFRALSLLYVGITNQMDNITKQKNTKETKKKILKNLKKDVTINDLTGEWIINNQYHPIKKFKVDIKNKQKDVITHHTHVKNQKIIAVIQTSDIEFNYKPFHWFKYQNKLNINIILYQNGQLEFAMPKNISLFHKLILTRTESQSWSEFIQNVIHISKHKCNCFGYISTSNQLVRYNRWQSKYPEFYYTASKKN